MQIGVNYATALFRDELTNLVNGSGLPPCVVVSVLSEALSQTRQYEVKLANQEKQEYDKEVKEIHNDTTKS